MNSVPFAFCEQVCNYLMKWDLSEAEKLSGIFGKFTRNALRNRAFSLNTVESGIEKEAILALCHNQKLLTPQEIETIPKKFIQKVTIHLNDAQKENVSQAIVRRFPQAQCNFVLQSPFISEAWVNFACSLKRLGVVAIWKKLEDEAIRRFQKLVVGRKLCWIIVNEEACEGDFMMMLKIVFCQDQFEQLRIGNYSFGPWKGNAVRELLHFWEEDSSGKLRGKHFSLDGNCKGGVAQLEQFLISRAPVSGPSDRRLPLEICSKEECDFLDKYYRYRIMIFLRPSCVYKFEQGEGDQRRRLYISFECAKKVEPTTGRRLAASHSGCVAITSMRNTSFLHILFV
uniref:F-box domain-containing protein n=1 Tax=Steinernema glaseri TaxID=37863 RepID=A0A1I7Y4H0_9BILA